LRVDEGKGVYPDEAVMLVKDLAARGIRAQYLHDSKDREWLKLMGEELAVALVIQLTMEFIASGAWEIFFDYLIDRFPKREIDLTFGVVEDPNNSQRSVWFEVRGDAKQARKAFQYVARQLNKRSGPNVKPTD
jgi:hypothetical protein